MTLAIERKFLMWFVGILLSILAFIGAIGVKSIMEMNRAIQRIEIRLATESEKHKTTEYRVELLERNKYGIKSKEN